MINEFVLTTGFLAGLLSLAGIAHAAPSRPIPATGASMDTADYRVVIHVKTGGNDTCAGTSAAKAVRTIGKAFEVSLSYLSKGKGTKVLIHPGRYHEPTVRMDGKALDEAGRNALFVVEGVKAGEVVISGSVRAGWEPATWKRLSPGGLIYSHAWPHAWPYDCGTHKPTDDGCMGWRREMVVHNKRVMRHEVTSDTLLNIKNTYFVNDSAKMIFLHLDREMHSGDLIEVPAQLHLLRIGHKNNVVVKKLVFEHDNSYIMSKLNDGDGWGVAVGFRTENGQSRGLLIEDCEFRQCNATALKLHGWNDATIRRCVANDNGWKGMGAGNCTNLLFEDCTTSYNSWRQEWSHGAGWDAAGLKIISRTDRVTIRRHYADSNTTASGIWFDSRNINAVIEGCVLERHHFDPLYLEASDGPTLITKCTVRNSVTGITTYCNSNTIVEECRFENIGGRMINIISDERRMSRGRTANENFQIRHCLFNGRGEAFASKDPSWRFFFRTLDSDSNTWSYGPRSDTAKVFADSAGTGVDFTIWKALGKDPHSTWAAEKGSSPPAVRSDPPKKLRR